MGINNEGSGLHLPRAACHGQDTSFQLLSGTKFRTELLHQSFLHASALFLLLPAVAAWEDNDTSGD